VLPDIAVEGVSSVEHTRRFIVDLFAYSQEPECGDFGGLLKS
jgi:hypothetical protein